MIDSVFLLFQRIFSFLGFISLVLILLLFANFLGFLQVPFINAGNNPTASGDQLAATETTSWFVSSDTDTEGTNSSGIPPVPVVAIISGHAGNDSGAVCENSNGDVVLSEADVVARIAALAADELRRYAYQVVLLEEYDPRLDGLVADVLISLHSDSCLDKSGYKAAYYEKSQIPEIDTRFITCIKSEYVAATGLAEHPNTITEDMTEYHAFRKLDPSTPAAILELGFLGGDLELLTQRPEQPAKGISDSIHCFLLDPASG